MNLFQSRRPGFSERGSATVEAAAFAVVGVVLALAGTDLVSYMRSRLALDQVSGSMASSVTQYQTLYDDDVTKLFQTAQKMADDIAVTGANGATIITGMSNVNGATKIIWQKPSPGSTGFTSSFGGVNATAQNLPDDYALPAGASVVAVEVFSSIKMWVQAAKTMGGANSTMLRSVALFHPRAAQLPTISTGNRP